MPLAGFICILIAAIGWSFGNIASKQASKQTSEKASEQTALKAMQQGTRVSVATSSTEKK